MTLADCDDPSSVLDGGIYFEFVSYYSGVTQKPRTLAATVSSDSIDVEVVECGAKIVALHQNRQPRQTRLIDLQHETLEQPGLISGLGKELLFVFLRWAEGR